MRLSLRAIVIGAFVALILGAGLQGVLGIATMTWSAQQVTALDRQGLVPAVGLGLLSQDIDQERALLVLEDRPMSAKMRRAITDELTSLDTSIASAARRVLPRSSLRAWHEAWGSYSAARVAYLRIPQASSSGHAAASLRVRLSDRLDAVLDVIQSDAGAHLYAGDLIYLRAMAVARTAIRIGMLSLVAVLVLGTVLAVIITRRLSHGLGNLAATARSIGRGRLDVRADERGRDEIAQLAAAFNHMTDALLSAERRADSDALTGLPNHRAMMQILDKELERSRRYGRPYAVLFVDLDHFKALNDSCGHAAGDAALCELVAIVGTTLRGVDTFGRWGGEEFVIVLPETAGDEALSVAERVRAAVAAHAFRAGDGVHLTCSVGVAAYPADAVDRDGLVEAADRAMYAAKHLGRNQARAAADPAVAALTQGGNSREDVALMGTVEALASLVEARDRYTGAHTLEVAVLATEIAQRLGLDAAEVRRIGLAGRLHDVGKVAVPDAILCKPAPLTGEEWAVMRRHPIVGADVVSCVPALRALAPLIRGHHERWDGQGYPDGQAGTAIPLGARIVAVVDAYGALTTDRPYRRGRDAAGALRELRRCAGAQFDPSIVAALAQVLAARSTRKAG